MAPITRLRLRVTPGARRSEFVGRHGDAWKLRVRAEVVAGHTVCDKVVALAGIEQAEAERRLVACAEGTRHAD